MKDRIQFSDLKERNPRAIQRLYENNFPLILQFVSLNNGTMNEARDIFHDSVFVLLERIDEKQVDESVDLTLYLYSIARLLWSDMLRDKLMDESNVRHVHEYLELDATKILRRINGVKQLAGKYRTLAEPGRTIVREHFANNITLSEIAQRMGFSTEESAVKGKLKALKKLIETS